MELTRKLARVQTGHYVRDTTPEMSGKVSLETCTGPTCSVNNLVFVGDACTQELASGLHDDRRMTTATRVGPAGATWQKATKQYADDLISRTEGKDPDLFASWHVFRAWHSALERTARITNSTRTHIKF